MADLFTKRGFRGVFYITPSENLPSIFEHGILSHEKAAGLPKHKTIYDEGIVASRGEKKTPDGKTLWQFANFYFQPTNPMLYRVHRGEGKSVVVLRLHNKVLHQAKYISIGNAASSASVILGMKEGMSTIQGKEMREILEASSWGRDERRRLIMSELLVPDRVAPEFIGTVYAPSKESARRINSKNKSPVVADPAMFFGHTWRKRLAGTKIELIDGDMIFSQMQTLTVSVNTVGVMGGGLAARARDDFPNLYVQFQKRCRSKELTTKTPYLYKDAYAADSQIADDTGRPQINGEKWFLLFATKQNWRNPSKMEYIHDGLQWLKENAVKNGITSLAMPALGCGLGGLRWEEVLPIMCQTLRELDIPCEIYLPQEAGKVMREAGEVMEKLSEKHLLGKDA